MFGTKKQTPDLSSRIIVTMYDKKAHLYLTPYTYRTVHEFYRDITNLLENNNSQIAKHPTDFDLYKLADFNELSGEVIPCDKPLFLSSAADLLPSQASIS